MSPLEWVLVLLAAAVLLVAFGLFGLAWAFLCAVKQFDNGEG